MVAHVLRPYQQAGLDAILKAYKDGARRVLAVSPTGSGKTTLFGSLASDLAAHGKKTLVLVHRRELATQAANRFLEFGVDFGFILRGMPAKPYAPIQIAGVQTLIKRNPPKADFVICDEAHLSTAATWEGILAHYSKVPVLGVSATPWRLGGNPLIGAYDATVVVSTPAELRGEGFLCPYLGFSYLAPDLSKVQKAGEDYNQQQSGAAMRQPQIVANIVEQWQKHASHLSTVVFCVTVEHSQELTAQFKAVGVRAEHVDGGTPVEQRRAILKRVDSGETQVLCNVGIAVEGLDIPRLKCCVLARPTMSLTRALQMVGRVMRPWNGIAARIHDHAFIINKHGLPDAERDYSLHAKREDPPSLTTCEVCAAVYESGRSCPSCQHTNVGGESGPRKLETIADAEMYEFASDDAKKTDPWLRPPVEITWTTPGHRVEGVFKRQWVDQTQWGPKNRYLVEGEKRVYTFPGTQMLDRSMKSIKPEDKIRVTFKGETDIGDGKRRKEFVVEKDEPEPVCVVEGCGKTFKQNMTKTKKTCSEECSKKRNSEQSRKWREADPEKYAEYQRKRYEANPEKYAEKNNKYREANPGKAAEYRRKRREARRLAAQSQEAAAP